MFPSESIKPRNNSKRSSILSNNHSGLKPLNFISFVPSSAKMSCKQFLPSALNTERASAWYPTGFPVFTLFTFKPIDSK